MQIIKQIVLNVKKSKVNTYYCVLSLINNAGRDYAISFDRQVIGNILDITGSEFDKLYPLDHEAAYIIFDSKKDIK